MALPMSVHFLALALLSLLPQSSAQSLDPSLCVAGNEITAFPQCDLLFESVNTCDEFPDLASYQSCYCQQSILNGIIDCNSEQRLCAANDDVDASFDDAVSIWHDSCDSVITFSPTTPPLATITSTYDVSFCITAQDKCHSRVDEINECTYSYESYDPLFASCYCQPKILSLAYTCEVIGNASCLGVPATVTNLGPYKVCPNFCDVLDCRLSNEFKTISLTSPATLSADITSSIASTTASTSSQQVLPASTTSATVPTTTSAARRNLVQYNYSTIGVMAMLVWIASLL